MNIEIKIYDERLREERYKIKSSEYNAGFDVRASIYENIEVLPGESVMIPLGFAMNIKYPGFAGYLMPRSGLGAKYGIVLGNLTGVIDAGYQGEVQASIWNRGRPNIDDIFIIRPMDRIAQIVIAPVVIPKLFEVNEFTTESERGENGFGSSGVK